MIRFNTLKISSDGTCFMVQVSVDSAAYYNERYITDVFIDSDFTFNNSTTPSNKAVHIEIEGTTTKSFSRVFSAAELSRLITTKTLRGHMLYVYVYVDGPITGDAPCGSDSDMYLGVAVDWNSLYHGSLGFMKQVTKECCNIPKEFIDYILRMKALELAIKTGHTMVAKNIWDKFFSKKRRMVFTPCGCNK